MDFEHQSKVLEQLMNVYGQTLDHEIIQSVALNTRFHFGRSSSMLDEITANITGTNSDISNHSTQTPHLCTPHISDPKLSPLTQATEHIKQGYKVLIILRGLPGSGKSYLARKIVEISVGSRDYHNFIFSADDYFIRRGVYQYDPMKLQDAHSFNQERAFDAMKRGVSPVIIDNTNTQMWEMKPYAVVAAEYAYIVEILEPNTPWAFNERELSKRNSHGVPRIKLKFMLERYERDVTAKRIFYAFDIAYRNLMPPQLRSYPRLPTPAENAKCSGGSKRQTNRIGLVKKTKTCKAPSVDDMLLYSENSNEAVLKPSVLTNGFDAKPRTNSGAFPDVDLSSWGVSETALHSWDICTPITTNQAINFSEPATSETIAISQVEMIDGATNTCSSDFLLVSNPDVDAKILYGNNRDINDHSLVTTPPLRKKIMVDKSSMVGKDLIQQGIDKRDALERLSSVFPSIPHVYLKEIYDRCQGDLNWATDILCEDNLHNLISSQEVSVLEEDEPEKEEQSEVFDSCFLQEERSNASSQEEDNATAVAEREELKRFLQEKVVISNDFYSEHTLKLKSRMTDSISQPSTSKMETMNADVGNVIVTDSDVDMDDFDLETASESAASVGDAQEMIELNLGDAFVTELENKLQEPTLQYPKGFLPIVQVPVALARQLYALYIESVYQQMDAQNEVLDMLVKEDEELARKIQAQEQQPQALEEAATIPEIMQEQYNLNVCKKETEQWKNLTPDDFAAKLTKKKLFESFPNIGQDFLLEIWQAHGNNYEETVESILASDPEQAVECDKKMIKSPPVPEEIVREMKEVHNQQQTPSQQDHANKTALSYREDAACHLENRKLLYQKAMQAYQRGMTELAIYYSDLARKQTELYDQANNLAATMFLNEHSERHQNYDTLDLHFLYVKEAIAALDMFLDNSVHLLKGTNKTQYLFVITGRGKRSANGISKIKPAVKSRLKKRKVNYVEINPGLLKVKVSEHSITTTDLPEVRSTT